MFRENDSIWFNFFFPRYERKAKGRHIANRRIGGCIINFVNFRILRKNIGRNHSEKHRSETQNPKKKPEIQGVYASCSDDYKIWLDLKLSQNYWTATLARLSIQSVVFLWTENRFLVRQMNKRNCNEWQFLWQLLNKQQKKHSWGKFHLNICNSNDSKVCTTFMSCMLHDYCTK